MWGGGGGGGLCGNSWVGGGGGRRGAVWKLMRLTWRGRGGLCQCRLVGRGGGGGGGMKWDVWKLMGGGGGGAGGGCVETGTGKALYWLGFQASLPARSAAQWLTNLAVTSAPQVLGSMVVSLFLHTNTTVCFSGVSVRFFHPGCTVLS